MTRKRTEFKNAHWYSASLTRLNMILRKLRVKHHCLSAFHILQNLALELEEYASSDGDGDDSASECSNTDYSGTISDFTTGRTSEIFRIADPANTDNNMKEVKREDTLRHPTLAGANTSVQGTFNV